jgi:hypothetical protein
MPVDLTITQPLTVPDGAVRVADVADVDLTDAATFHQGVPHGEFDKLRAVAPVAWHDEKPTGRKSAELHSGLAQPESPGFWAVTSHDHVTTVSKDPELYSSYLGGTQMFSADEMLLAGLRLMLLYMDPPDQTRLRKILVPSFTPRSIGLMEDAIIATARKLADDVAGAGSVDLAGTRTGTSNGAIRWAFEDLAAIPWIVCPATDVFIGLHRAGRPMTGSARPIQRSRVCPSSAASLPVALDDDGHRA